MQQIRTFAEIEEEFLQRVRAMEYCGAAISHLGSVKDLRRRPGDQLGTCRQPELCGHAIGSMAH